MRCFRSPEATSLRERSHRRGKWDIVHAEILLRLDHLDEARAVCWSHLERPASISSANDLASLRRLEGLCLSKLGDADGAMRSLEMARALYHHTPHRLGEADALLSLGRLNLDLCRWQSARDELREAKEIYEGGGSEAKAVLTLLRLVTAHLGLGDVVEARRALASAWRMWRGKGDQNLATELRRTTAGLHVRLGSPAAARRFFGPLSDASDGAGVGTDGASTPSLEDLETETELDLAEGRAGDAVRKLNGSLSRIQTSGPRGSWRLRFAHLRARSYLALDRSKEAMSILLEAVSEHAKDRAHGRAGDVPRSRSDKDAPQSFESGHDGHPQAFRNMTGFLTTVPDRFLRGRLGLVLCEIGLSPPNDPKEEQLLEIREVLLDSRSHLRAMGRDDLVRQVDRLLEEIWIRCPWTQPPAKQQDEQKQAARPSGHYVRHRKYGSGEFVTRDRRLLAMLENIDLIAQTDLPVLISGESGTGKELIASAIHAASERRDRPFVPINCGAIPGELHESEFFGHLRGSFTGATADKTGLFEQAHGGTVFLDEIGEMEPQAQVKLLRILESGEIRRVGETRLRTVDVRVVTATNTDLEKKLAEGRFRPDLFYRIRGYEIHLPPLRDRPGDILVIAEHFLREGNRGYPRQLRFAPDARRLFLRHDWQGNVRELRFIVQKGVAHARLVGDKVVTTGMLGIDGLERKPESFWKSPLEIQLPLCAPLDHYLEEMERQIVIQALEENSWNRTRAAQALGQISRTTLIGKMKRLGLFTDSRKPDRDSRKHGEVDVP